MGEISCCSFVPLPLFGKVEDDEDNWTLLKATNSNTLCHGIGRIDSTC